MISSARSSRYPQGYTQQCSNATEWVVSHAHRSNAADSAVQQIWTGQGCSPVCGQEGTLDVCLDLAGDGHANQLGVIGQAADEWLCPVHIAGLHAGRDEGASHPVVHQEEVLVLVEDGRACMPPQKHGVITSSIHPGIQAKRMSSHQGTIEISTKAIGSGHMTLARFI